MNEISSIKIESLNCFDIYIIKKTIVNVFVYIDKETHIIALQPCKLISYNVKVCFVIVFWCVGFLFCFCFLFSISEKNIYV